MPSTQGAKFAFQFGGPSSTVCPERRAASYTSDGVKLRKHAEVQFPVAFKKAHLVCRAQSSVEASVSLQGHAAIARGEEFMMTEDIRPSVRGESMRRPAVMPPLLWPHTVTLEESPPK